MATSNEVGCKEVAAQLARLLEDGSPAELREHLADCDACRDLRHDAERVQRLLSLSGSDFQLPSDLVERLGDLGSPISGDEVATREAAPTAAAPPGRWRDFAKRWAAPIVATLAAAAVVGSRVKEPSTSPDDPEISGPPWRGKVGRVVSREGKLQICAPRGGACQDAREGDDVPAGSLLETDRRTLAELYLSDGSTLSLDRGTTLRLSTRGRGGELVRGGLVADVTHQGTQGARFDFKAGHVDVLGTKLALRSDEESATVHVARGEVRLSDRRGHDTLVLAGQEGRLFPGSGPVTSTAASLGEALGFSETVQREHDDEPEPRPRALGELKAQKPGERQERAGAVRLESHAVRVKIAGAVARTEVEEVFSNQTDEVLEGIFRFPLPADAKIERLALEVDGKLEEGAFVDRERAAAIWRGAIVNAAPQLRREIKDEIVWVPGPWRDPALLEWQRGGRFELRVFPIPRRGSRRVVLAYSQLVKQAAGARHYSYPLGFDPSGHSSPLELSVDVQVRGNDPAFGVRTPGWELTRNREGGAEHLHFEAKSFVPNGDLAVDYALPDRSSEVSAWAYRDVTASGETARPYVALALRPQLPKQVRRGPGRAIALVVDASRSVFGENFRRATSLAARLAGELDPTDRVTVLACDTTCRELPGDLLTPGPDAARQVRGFLGAETPAGATDVTLAVQRGFGALTESGRSPRVVYIGDGTATAGPVRSATVERAVRAVLPTDGSVITVGIGPESDADALLAVARGGAGSSVPYVPGQPLSDAVFSTISALSGATLSDVQLELPPGMVQVAPTRLDPVVAGTELIVTGRLDTPSLAGNVTLRGSVNGRPFEQRYRVDVTPSDQSGNAFVPRLFAAARITDLERDGSDGAKREAIELSTRHGVASHFTSLLVLESEAMYKAFGLDNARKAPEYTAELEADGVSASGELALNDDEERKDKDVAGEKQAKASPAPRHAMEAFEGGGRSSSFDSDDAPPSAPAPAAPARPKRAEKPAFAPPPAPTSSLGPERLGATEGRSTISEGVLEPVRPRPRPRPMIPMRRIWERKGEIFTDRFVPKAASASALSEAQRELARDDSRRQNLKKLFALTSASGDLGEAARLAERWVEKEPLDPEALTALADVEARRGHRDAAIRMLGSVLDMRPGDTASHRRLARLERWAGRPELACRHEIAIAEGRGNDAQHLANAVRCARSVGMAAVADALSLAIPTAIRAVVEQMLKQPESPTDVLSGDVRLQANWNGGVDLDLSLLDTEGHRISWLGAATRAVISAQQATSTSQEGLALRGAQPGEYVLELTRGSGGSDVTGEVIVTVAGVVRRIPFSFAGDRKPIALLRLSMQPRLVPL